MHPNNVGRVANSVDPDQTALQEQSDLGLQFAQTCLSRPVCPKN